METTDNLKNIITRQKEVLAALEKELRELEGSDLARENAELKKDLEKLRADIDQSRAEAGELAVENAGLRTALYEQIYNDKVNLVNSAQQRLEIYFGASQAEEMNRLSALEAGIRGQIDHMRNILAWHHVDIHSDIYARLGELWDLLNMKVTEARAAAARPTGAFTEEERAAFEALKNEQITDEQIRRVTRKNNIEKFLGLNVFNIIGILLLVVGAIAFARFAFVLLPDEIKGVMLFALGGALLAIGEILNRKKPGVFSLGLTAGGIGIMYTAMVASFFALEILSAYPTAAICVLITAGAFILANRYNSQVIAAFALFGGYMPLFALDSLSSSAAESVLYGAMVYFVVLNLFALLISFRKKWRVTAFIGLFLNAAGTLYISDFFSYGSADTFKTATIIVYVLFAFLIYTAIPVVGTYRAGLKFMPSDIVLLSINTVFSSCVMYYVFYQSGLEDFGGLLAIIFAGIYFTLGKLIDKRFKGEAPGVKALFYITGLAFVVLFVPLQFGEVWLSLGWLIEGVLLAVYGIVKNEKSFRLAGYIISGLCLIAFLSYDLAHAADDLFPYKYLAITLCALAILGAYMYKKTMYGKVYKYFALANLWVFVMYMLLGRLQDFLGEKYASAASFNHEYLVYAAAIVVTYLFAYIIIRVRLWHDLGTRGMSAVLYIVGIVMHFAANANFAPAAPEYLGADSPSTGVSLAAALILAALGFASVIAVRELMKMMVTGRMVGVEWYPLVVSGYIIIILTQILITQYDISFTNALISIIYGLTALAWIVFGFVRRFSTIRKFGLGLAMFSVIKLILVDLSDLTEGYRIISYFALGLILIAISFGYQYFSKRLELLYPTDEEKAET